MRSLPLAALVALAASGCGASSTPGATVATAPHDPCDGAELDLGEAAQACRVEGEPGAPPSPDVVRVAIATTSLASGADAAIQLAFSNTGSDAVELDFPGTLRFDASLFDGDGRRVDERWDGVGALSSSAVRCRDGADCRTVRVRLAAGGTLIASIPFAARVEVVRQVSGGMERSDGGAIAPGSYRARVMLPWMDAVAGSATGARTTRVVEGPLAITR